MKRARTTQITNIINDPRFNDENDFINKLDNKYRISIRDKANDLVSKLNANTNISHLRPGPLFYPQEVQEISPRLFPHIINCSGVADSDIICKYAILSLLAKGGADIIMAFCVRCIRTCKNTVGVTYLLGSLFNALDPENNDYDIAIQVCLTDILVDFIDVDYSNNNPGVALITPSFKLEPNGLMPTYKNIEEFLGTLFNQDASDMLNTLFRSTVGFIIPQLGESKAIEFNNQWSVNLICSFVDLNIALYGSGQGLLTMFLISVVKRGKPLACLELARSYINLAGLIAYSKLGFKRDRERLLWNSQTDDDLFSEPTNLQMSIELNGVTPAELIRRFNGKWTGKGPAPEYTEYKHELARVQPRQANIPFELFGTSSNINNTQIEAAMVLTMIECMETMIECLQKGLTTRWRGDITYKTLYNKSLKVISPESFLVQFGSYYEYNFCRDRIRTFYNRLVSTLKPNNDPIKTLSEYVNKLKIYYGQVCNAASSLNALHSTSDPAEQNKSTRKFTDAWRTREERALRTGTDTEKSKQLINQLEGSDYSESSFPSSEESDISDISDTSYEHDSSTSAASTPTALPSPLHPFGVASTVKPYDISSTVQPSGFNSQDKKQKTQHSGGKKTKRKRNGNGNGKRKPFKNTNKHANKKSKKIQRIGLHKKMFRNKTQKSR